MTILSLVKLETLSKFLVILGIQKIFLRCRHLLELRESKAKKPEWKILKHSPLLTCSCWLIV